MRTRSVRVGSRGCLSLAAFVLAGETARAESYKVTTTDDSGKGSLRAAIDAANQRLGADRIKFDIPGSGPYVITLDSVLPTIVDELVIDGTTQPGFDDMPLVVVDGSRVGGAKSGFTLAAERCGIIGMSVTGWGIPDPDGTAIVVSGANCLIAGCYVGLRPSSTTWWNGENGIRVQGAHCVIEDCVVSGNAGVAILFEPGASDGAVRHNFIGPEPSGIHSIGNGAAIVVYAPRVTVGGDPEDRNLIAGNNAGVSVGGTQASGVVIESNWIGLDATGKVALTNFSPGIELSNGPSGCEIRRNVVSGNYYGGISLIGTSTDANVVSENLVGLDATGVLPIGNGFGRGGIGVSYDAHQNTIGPLNVVSGHEGIGISVIQRARNTLITGNLVGTDATGAAWLGNGGGIALDFNPGATRVTENLIVAPDGDQGPRFAGVHVTGGSGHLLDGNVIRSHSVGIFLEWRALGSVIDGNEITDCAHDGIWATDQVFDVEIVANRITRCGRDGVNLVGSSFGNPTRVTLRGNSLFENGDLAIDLGRFGLNDDDEGDGDAGPNGLQNRPVLDWALNEADGLHVSGRLNSRPLRVYSIDLYGCTTGDPEAEVQLATFDVTTDANGDASFRVVVPSWMPGLPVSATATNDVGSTSEVGWVLVSPPLAELRVPPPPPPPTEKR